MNQIKQKLQNLLQIAIKDTFDVNLINIKLENPPKKELGDFAFGCFILSKETKKNPALISGELSKNLENNPNIKEVSTAGPYLNIKLSKDFYSNIFKNYTFKHPNIGENQKIIVDYIGANVGKPLHIGHMCTPNQGQTIINLYKKLGYEVISDSHIGDWGIIFGKLITAYKKWGDKEKLKNNAVDYLLELYIKITKEAKENPKVENDFREEFKKLSTGEEENIKLWANFTKESIKAMNILLERLGVKPDYNIGESFYEGLGLPKMEDYPNLKYSMKDIVQELLEKNIATKNDDGSVGVVFSEESKIPSCILQKRDGTHGYLASDLAAIKYRITNWTPEKILYFVDVRQKLHLQQAFEIAKIAGWLNPPIINNISINKGKIKRDCELFHAYNGFISLKTGAMSSRKGNIIKLDKLLDEARERSKKIILEKRDDLSKKELEELSEIIGVGAIKYSYLSKSRTTDVVFDWDEAISFEGNSGPYLQYAYVRALRLIEKSGLNKKEINNFKSGINLEYPQEIQLFKNICDYNEILTDLKENLLTHTLCSYLYSLVKDFSSLYNEVSILSQENENLKYTKIKLVLEFIKVVEDIFEILAIKLPTKM